MDCKSWPGSLWTLIPEGFSTANQPLPLAKTETGLFIFKGSIFQLDDPLSPAVDRQPGYVGTGVMSDRVEVLPFPPDYGMIDFNPKKIFYLFSARRVKSRAVRSFNPKGISGG